ncbi:hypothetical protein GP486_005852 [Trichoglossum hirsutum]|uniref:ATP-dependent RNA helicase SUV3, mitochondrial n=1 Tax=Trichoglossum hirsutum TaxID=265104 RepID=A0A9P8L8H0_9PEZI|nr:hypothetical protein GP486_005852 [Trichoglossum hirsutum]
MLLTPFLVGAKVEEGSIEGSRRVYSHDSRNAFPQRASGSKALSLRLRERMKSSKVEDIIEQRLDALKDSLGETWSDRGEFEAFFARFKTSIKLDSGQSRLLPTPSVKARAKIILNSKSSGATTALYTFRAFRQAFVKRGLTGLDSELKHAFIGFVTDSRSTEQLLNKQVKVSDLRHPIEWYPATRARRRTIHLHVGPTNSGKTYHALQRLEQAKTGLYAGPLRLLAHEVYTRMNAKGKPCNLITGEEKRIIEGEKNPMISCTVEMTPLHKDLDVAVIDEIQMIGSWDRGWAWTQALLGVQAREVHLCGEERVVPLIRHLTSLMGESLEIHRYARLNPLTVESMSLKGGLHSLKKGDCVVVFSRAGIHAMKKKIESTTGKRCAVVYGSLPPETRAQQARLFNDPDSGYDILVASDAIGMGLNLSIKRIIFETTRKIAGGCDFENLTTSEIKQIAGRAGRYRTASDDTRDTISAASSRGGEVPSQAGSSVSSRPSIGSVTTLEDIDLRVVRKAMGSEADPIPSAGIFAPVAVTRQFVSYFPPNTPFSFVLRRLHEISRVNSLFHLCELDDQLTIADLIEPIKGLSVTDRVVICRAPVDRTADGFPEMVQALAKCIARRKGGALLEIKEIPLELLNRPVVAEKAYLASLETLHKGLSLYLWLSYRFEGVFPSRPLAFQYKGMVENNIDKILSGMYYEPNIRPTGTRKELEEVIKKVRTEYRGAEKQGTHPEAEIPMLLGNEGTQNFMENMS